MTKKKIAKSQNKTYASKHSIQDMVPRADPHSDLIDKKVHVFVDDQNLFYGITNQRYGPEFRIDFGRLLLEACRMPESYTRAVGSAYIAGVIPDDDSFWQIAQNQGFVVHRGFLGSNNRSKQDDAFLVAEMVETIYTQPGPSTIVLIAGDADYVPALMKTVNKGWRNEIAFIDRGLSRSLESVAHQFREIVPYDIQLAASITD